MKKLVVSLCVLASVLNAAPEKVTYDDVAGKNYYSTYGEYDIRIQYFSNMNFNTQVDVPFFGWRDLDDPLIGQPRVSGEWAIENGVMTSEAIPNGNANKTIATIEPDFVNKVIVSHLSGRGTILTDDTRALEGVDDISGDIKPGYEVSIAELQGKKITLGSVNIYFFNNMTAILMEGDTTLFKGTWKIEKGVVVLDGGWEDHDENGDVTGLTVETSSILFSTVPAVGAKFNIWTNAKLDPNGSNVNVDAIADIAVSDTIPAPFNNNPVPYLASVEEFSGQSVVFEHTLAGHIMQTEITFNDNMTFSLVDDFEGGNPEISTGIWSVEEGVVILDTVYNDNYVSQNAIIFSSRPQSGVSYELLIVHSSDSAAEGEGIGAVAISEMGTISKYPLDDTPTPTVSPATIMYLLN